MTARKQLLFLHIPKTAGMTLHNIIHRNYRSKNILSIYDLKGNKILYELPKEKFDRYQVFAGHISAQAISLFEPNQLECFTILREPIARVVSAYHYIARAKWHPYHATFHKNKPSIIQLLESGDVLNMNNGMVRFLSGDHYRAYDTCDEVLLEKALHNLRTYFPIIGLQDDFDTFLMQLVIRYNWNFPYYKPVNLNPNADRSKPMDPETAACIARYNHLDIQLYRIMKAEVEQKQAQLGDDFQKRLAKFKSRNAVLGKYSHWIRPAMFQFKKF